MINCQFIHTLPEYVLDRTIVINGVHEHRISGYKLAKASEFFKRQLIQIRLNEIEKSNNLEEENNKRSSRRSRARSLCDLELEHLNINYDDLYGFEIVLSFIHCSEVGHLKLAEKLNSLTMPSILKACLHFEVPSCIEFFEDVIKSKLNASNIIDYWRAVEEFSTQRPELTNYCKTYLLKNFLDAGQSEKFKTLFFEELKILLCDDALNARSELIIFELISLWIAFDRENRKGYTADLLNCLRLGWLTKDELLEVSRKECIQASWSACDPIIANASLAIEELANIPHGNISRQAGDDKNFAYLRRPRFPHSAIFVIGGWEGNHDDPNFGPSQAVQVYNSRGDCWRRITGEGIALDEGHAYSGCVLYKNKIYIIGGYVASGPTQTLKVFELVTKTWKYLSPMHEKRNYVCTCLLENAIYAIGGHNGRHRLNSVERYDPDQNSWTLVSHMKQVRSDAGSDSLMGKIYVCGGFDGHHFYDSVESYDPKVDQWTFVAPMQNIRSGVCVTSYKNYFYVIGGNDGLQRLRTVERYDAETNQWQTMPSMIRQRSNFCVVLLEDTIYVMGGWSDETNSTIALVERWMPNTLKHWQPVHELFLPASANCCCSVNGLDLIKDFL